MFENVQATIEDLSIADEYKDIRHAFFFFILITAVVVMIGVISKNRLEMQSLQAQITMDQEALQRQNKTITYRNTQIEKLTKEIESSKNIPDELAFYRKNYPIITKALDEKNVVCSPLIAKYGALEEMGKKVMAQKYELNKHDCTEFSIDYVAGAKQLGLMAFGIRVETPDGDEHDIACLGIEPQGNQPVPLSYGYKPDPKLLNTYTVVYVTSEADIQSTPRPEALEHFCKEPIEHSKIK
jgi:hypothetical protein